MITLIAFVLSVFIKIFVEQGSRIEELEKKVGELLNNKQNFKE